MKFDNYHIFEMDVTKEEMNTITSFCRFLDDIMDYRDNYEEVYDVVKAVWRHDNKDLERMHVKINIEEEN